MSAEDWATALPSPEHARQALEVGSSIDARRLRALNTVEAAMDNYFRGDDFKVGFAEPPLGGTEAWLEEEMVPFICDQAEKVGWDVSIDGNQLIFKAPPKDEAE